MHLWVAAPCGLCHPSLWTKMCYVMALQNQRFAEEVTCCKQRAVTCWTSQHKMVQSLQCYSATLLDYSCIALLNVTAGLLGAGWGWWYETRASSFIFFVFWEHIKAERHLARLPCCKNIHNYHSNFGVMAYK